jgi:hypothetical protein
LRRFAIRRRRVRDGRRQAGAEPGEALPERVRRRDGHRELAFAAPISQSSLDRTEAAPAANTGRGATDEPGPLPHLLGTALMDAAEAAASLHPAFYVGYWVTLL